MTRLRFRTGLAITTLLVASPGRATARPLQAAPYFEPNAGQAGADARFLLRTNPGTFFFTDTEVVLAAPAAAPLRVRFLGADPAVRVDGAEPRPGTVSYFVGADPQRWRAGLPTYAEIRYAELYPGVSLAYRADGKPLKGTYTVAPYADPGRIRWRYEGGEARVDEAGRLHVRIGAGDTTLTEEAPVAWQEVEDGRVTVAARYALAGDGSVGFAVDAYDPARPLTIDPVIAYSTFLGGSIFDIAWSVAADAAGNAYIAGHAASANFPTVDPYQPFAGGQGDGFVAKFAPDGTPIYSTYLGGSYLDYATDIAVDAAGNAYVTGKTGSVNFPTKNALQPAYAGGWDAFVAKIDPTGSALVYSTYLGGSNEENYINAGVSGAIAVDAAGAAYVTGSTQSANFPTAQPFQPLLRGTVDAFVSKLSPSGGSLVYSTFLGGTSGETGWGIAVSPAGQAVVTGDTTSPSTFPTKAAYQPLCAPGPALCWDAFVTRFAADGKSLVFSTYLGGNDAEYVDRGMGVAVDAAGVVYVTGMTGSTNFPVLHAYQPAYGGQVDAFVSRFGRGGRLVSSTYLGGSNSEVGYGIAVRRVVVPPGVVQGAIHVSGLTLSQDFPVVNPLQGSLGGFEDPFVSRFNLTASQLQFSTYFGGANGREEYGSTGIALDAAGNAYVTGGTEATDYPTVDPYQAAPAGSYDAFLTRIDP
jgi:hypothetical protein